MLARFGNITLFNRNRLGRLVKVASKIIGLGQDQFNYIFNWHVLRKAYAILDYPGHPLQDEFNLKGEDQDLLYPCGHIESLSVITI